MSRLFLALWPDSAARAALAQRAKEVVRLCGGRPVPAANLHLTLVFLGEVDPGRVGDLRMAAQGTTGHAFDLELDCVGGFRRSGVAWAGCRRAPVDLVDLQAALESRIRAAGFQPDARAFAPHLTLARHVRAPVTPTEVGPVSWRVEAFALVESARGEGAYRTLAEWPLDREKKPKDTPDGASPS